LCVPSSWHRATKQKGEQGKIKLEEQLKEAESRLGDAIVAVKSFETNSLPPTT
jgi:hypothetical protein